MLTVTQLTEIAERCDKATQGQWGTSCHFCSIRGDIPALLDTVQELRELLGRGQTAITADLRYQFGSDVEEALR